MHIASNQLTHKVPQKLSVNLMGHFMQEPSSATPVDLNFTSFHLKYPTKNQANHGRNTGHLLTATVSSNRHQPRISPTKRAGQQSSPSPSPSPIRQAAQPRNNHKVQRVHSPRQERRGPHVQKPLQWTQQHIPSPNNLHPPFLLRRKSPVPQYEHS